jgi:hypothetical protein
MDLMERAMPARRAKLRKSLRPTLRRPLPGSAAAAAALRWLPHRP